MWQPRVPGKSRLGLTAADGLGDSYIGRAGSDTPHLKGMNDGDEIAFTVRQRGQALPGNGLVVDPALGHPSRSTLASNFFVVEKVKRRLAERRQSISHGLKPQTISPLPIG